MGQDLSKISEAMGVIAKLGAVDLGKCVDVASSSIQIKVENILGCRDLIFNT